MNMVKRVTDEKESERYATTAIRYLKHNPCSICALENYKTHECVCGVRYRATCKVFRKIADRLSGLQ